jgi:hypothetical protein
VREGEAVSIVDFFRKKLEGSESSAQPSARKSDRLNPQPVRTTVRIDFEMMLKGSIYDRPSGRVRQFGVTVDGATKVVTSGDFVNRETYDALLKAGAIRPRSENPPPEAPVPPHKRRQREAN